MRAIRLTGQINGLKGEHNTVTKTIKVGDHVTIDEYFPVRITGIKEVEQEGLP